jgi:hypothetical protein
MSGRDMVGIAQTGSGKTLAVSTLVQLHSLPLLSPQKKELRGFGTRANCSDQLTAACWRSECQLLRIEGVVWSSHRIPTVVKLGFLDWSRYFFLQVAPQLSSWGWVDPVSDPLLLRKFGSAGNWTRDLCVCSQKLTTRPQRRTLPSFLFK